MVSQHALLVSRPTPRGKLRGLAWGGGLQAHTWGSPDPHLGGVSQHALRQTPPTATAAGGTHPTGMHSCLNRKMPNVKYAVHFSHFFQHDCKRFNTVSCCFKEVSKIQNIETLSFHFNRTQL